MIIDRLKNAYLYYGLGNRVKKALQYLENNDLSKLEPGKYEIDGTDIFLIINHKDTKQREECPWEAHRRYIDIQYVLTGIEQIGYAYIDEMEVAMDYDENKDCIFFKGEGDLFTVSAGTFALFNPEDVHRPGICIDKPEAVKKAVVKVLV
jgi:YhcH/YjgK/YiaL family protein